MKKHLILFVIILSPLFAITNSNAQTSWELGVRFGESGSVEATIPLGKSIRLQPAVYFYDRYAAAAYFDWMFKLSDGPSGLKFYPGVGPEFYFENRFDFSVAGNFGAEYAFEFPLTVGFDWRPALRLTNGADFYGGNWGFTARFRFGEYVKFEKAD